MKGLFFRLVLRPGFAGSYQFGLQLCALSYCTGSPPTFRKSRPRYYFLGGAGVVKLSKSLLKVLGSILFFSIHSSHMAATNALLLAGSFDSFKRILMYSFNNRCICGAGNGVHFRPLYITWGFIHPHFTSFLLINFQIFIMSKLK